MSVEYRKPLSPLAAAQAALAEANRRMLVDEQLQHALEAFEQIMEYRGAMYLRLSQRVRTTVRGGMVVFALIGLAMFVLLATLVTQVQHAVQSTTMLTANLQSVTADMQSIEQAMLHMDERMHHFASIGEHMHVMTDHTTRIADGMSTLQGRMQVIERQMTTINGRLYNVTGHMGVMGDAVNGMGHSIHEVTRPFGMLP